MCIDFYIAFAKFILFFISTLFLHFNQLAKYGKLWCHSETARREYDINLFINNTIISKVIIDDHYEKKHSESVDDKIIISLVKKLNNEVFEASSSKGDYHYFVTEKVLNEKNYRLVWLLEDN